MPSGYRVDQRIIGRWQGDLDIRPVCFEFFGENFRERVVDALAHFRLRARDTDATRRRDFEISTKARSRIGNERCGWRTTQQQPAAHSDSCLQ